MKILEKLQFFTGWETCLTSEGMYIRQHDYISHLLTNHSVSHVKPFTTPLPQLASISGKQDNKKFLGPSMHKTYRI